MEKEGYLTHPFPTIRSFQNCWKVSLKLSTKSSSSASYTANITIPNDTNIETIFSYDKPSSLTAKPDVLNPIARTLALNSTQSTATLRHCHQIYSNEDPTYRTNIDEGNTFSFTQLYSISLFSTTPSNIEAILEGPNLMAVVVPWIDHQHHIMPTLTKKSIVGEV